MTTRANVRLQRVPPFLSRLVAGYALVLSMLSSAPGWYASIYAVEDDAASAQNRFAAL
jgi:hypothetical protein